MAARWNTKRAPAQAARTAPGSRRSASTRSASTAARLRQSVPAPVIATTCAPPARTALATADPMSPEAPVTTTRSPGSILTWRGSKSGTDQLSVAAGDDARSSARPSRPAVSGRPAVVMSRPAVSGRPAAHGRADRLAEGGTEGTDRRVAVRAGPHPGSEPAPGPAGQGAHPGGRRRHGGKQQAGHHRRGVPRLGQVDLQQQVGSGVAHVGLEARRAAGVARPLPGRDAGRVEYPRDV